MMQQVNVLVGGPDEFLPEDVFTRAGQWLGVDGGAVTLAQHHRKMIAAIGDFDTAGRMGWAVEQVSSWANLLVQAPPEKDDTDTELALRWLVTTMPEAAITVYGATGGRLDHLLANILFPLRPEFRQLASHVTLRDRQNVVRFYLPGTHKLVPEDQARYLAVIPLMPVTGLTLRGLKYPLTEAHFSTARALVSNEFSAPTAQLSFTQGVVGVIQSRDLLNHG